MIMALPSHFSFIKSFWVLLEVDKQCIQYFKGAGYVLKSLLAGLSHSSQLSSFSSVWFFFFFFYFFELTLYHLDYFYSIIRFISLYNSWVLSLDNFLSQIIKIWHQRRRGGILFTSNIIDFLFFRIIFLIQNWS